MGFPAGSDGKEDLPAMQETRGQSHPLEKDMATHSNILAWRSPWTYEPGGYNPQGRKEPAMTEQLTLSCSHMSKSKMRQSWQGKQ